MKGFEGPYLLATSQMVVLGVFFKALLSMSSSLSLFPRIIRKTLRRCADRVSLVATPLEAQIFQV